MVFVVIIQQPLVANMVKPVRFQSVVFCKDALKVLFHKYFLMFIFNLKFSFCCVPVSPMRKAPAHEAEMVSQLVFGEYVCIIETNGTEWLRVACKYDGYQGWCQFSHITPAGEADFNREGSLLAAGWVNEVEYNGQQMFIPYGSSIAPFRDGEHDCGKNNILFKAPAWNPEEVKIDNGVIMQTAFKFLNTAYLWGGKTVFGTDCSGFTQTVFKFLNLQLPRDAHAQAERGEVVDFLQEAQCGDLAFFDNEDGRIIHVGLLLNVQEIIHAAGKVRVDKIDNAGIINSETGLRTHRLRIIKRYF
jgi:gamma-D-glutamyl-L-lysine dipeptidyl-peptidase